MTLKEINAKKKELKEILQQHNEVARLTELKRLAKEVGAMQQDLKVSFQTNINP